MSISVIIPTYNSSDFVKDSIESVLSNKYQDLEIIIVDDLSDDIDKLMDIIKSYSEVSLIVKDKKSNASDSRNIGFLKSSGDIVFFLDSDDKFLPDHIKKRIEMHMSNNIGVIFGAYLVNDKPENITEYNNIDFRKYLFEERGDIRSSTISIYKKTHKGTLFDKYQFKHQDWGFGINCYDSNESICYDNGSSVNIDEGININRMSNKSNLMASKYFIDKFNLSNINIYYFIKKHVFNSIICKDKLALSFYRNKLNVVFKNISISFKFKIFIIMILSYLPSHAIHFLMWIKQILIKPFN